jgi:3-deoxy-7-phosphoheptulonate synthase
MGIDGLLIETHPNPKVALSDASQQLNYMQFEQLYRDLQKVAESVGYKMV